MFNGVLTGLGLARKIYGFPVNGKYKFVPLKKFGTEETGIGHTLPHYEQKLSNGGVIKFFNRDSGVCPDNAFAMATLNFLDGRKFIVEIGSKNKVIKVLKNFNPDRRYVYGKTLSLYKDELCSFKPFARFAKNPTKLEEFLESFEGFWEHADIFRKSA